MKKNCFVFLLIAFLIGFLFGKGFSDWTSTSNRFDTFTNWIIAIGTILLFLVALLTALSWKAQRIPEARKDFINAIVDFDNYIYQFGADDFTSTQERFKFYHTQLLNKIWNVEKSIMYFYQFDKNNKSSIDRQYCKIINLINELSSHLKEDNQEKLSFQILNRKLLDFLPESYKLLKLVVGQDLTIENKVN